MNLRAWGYAASVAALAVVVFGARGTTLLPVPSADPISVDFAMCLVHAGYEEDLEAIWADNPRGILRPEHVDRAVPELLDPAAVGTDRAALAAFARWALQDAGSRRMRGVRGMAAYVTVPEPRLRAREIERVWTGCCRTTRGVRATQDLGMGAAEPARCRLAA